MGKKRKNILKQELDIPNEVMTKLVQNRESILNNTVKQEKKKFTIRYKKQLITTLAIAASLLIIAIVNPQMNTAIKHALGISQDEGVAVVENNGIQSELNLTSTQNGREITLTKFVSTKKKFAFDYQFKLDDEKLKELIQKQNNPDRVFTKNAANAQHIDIGLFANDSTEDLFSGVSSQSTFRVEGDTFYGSVVATFTREKIPEDAKLTLHIYKLYWQDAEELDQAFLEASKTNSPFGVDYALKYEGDWRFDIDYKPLTQKADTQITNVSNITDIKTKNDALQTTLTFVAPFQPEESPAVTLYKDGVKTENQIFMEMYNPETGEVTISFSLSALDKTSVYTVQLNKIDFSGEPLEEIGHFDIQNK
ncbi:hypothetical protein [Candidatus Enterococcus mansonii]|uniref:DUF4179 domain-containing protein n=1 Tax=Candidatus Enterococcus mansonii TaxID=1834181 RepID=A0A242CFI7_9ENTE|nr:hypothetical protein [Enterococcus sp. 4G2_DIV0659]OTO08542.1 hypothetical protein A5880_001542 [Enterococcus sp. 4G2_DIV0659]